MITNPKKIIGKAQADGAQIVTFDMQVDGHRYNQHQIQVTVRDSDGVVAIPTAGSITVKVMSPGTDEYEAVLSGDIDLTSRDNWLQILDGRAKSIQFTPTSIDAAKTYDLSVSSGET